MLYNRVFQLMSWFNWLSLNNPSPLGFNKFLSLGNINKFNFSRLIEILH